MSIKNGPAYVVGQGLYNFAFIRERFGKQLVEQAHPADEIEFQAAAMTVMSVIHHLKNVRGDERALGSNTVIAEDLHQMFIQTIIDLLFDIYRMKSPEVAG